MKKVLLIGDSIRMGYDKYVREALNGAAEVYYNDDSARFAEYTLRYLHEWKKNRAWPDDIDLVHWNTGLWDAIELFDDEPLTSVEYYESVILRIHKRLRYLFPKAKLVFATSTAVIEEDFHDYYKRSNAFIESLNSAARRALSDTDAVINDLYAITRECPEEYHSDATHYATDAGTELIGKQVVSVICKELGILGGDIDISGFKREHYSKETIGY